MKSCQLYIFAAAAFLSSCNQTTEAVEVIDVSDTTLGEALRACKTIVAGNVGGAPLDVQNYGSGDEFYFAWPGGNIPGGRKHKVNGVTVDASASCIGSLSQRSIQNITANNKDVAADIPRAF